MPVAIKAGPRLPVPSSTLSAANSVVSHAEDSHESSFRSGLFSLEARAEFDPMLESGIFRPRIKPAPYQGIEIYPTTSVSFSTNCLSRESLKFRTR